MTKVVKPAVLGLGYAGLPLAIELARSGLSVVGVDPDRGRVEKLKRGQRYIDDVGQQSVVSLLRSRTSCPTADYCAIGSSDTVNICVPTPLRKTKDPDLSYIVAAAKSLVAHLDPGMLVIIESTAYPGTTEEVVLPILLKVGKEFFLCYSPERMDPGNNQFHARNIPKAIGEVTPLRSTPSDRCSESRLEARRRGSSVSRLRRSCDGPRISRPYAVGVTSTIDN